MTHGDFRAGLLIRGGLAGSRHLKAHSQTLSRFADGETEQTGEAYLTHFVFGDDYRRYFIANGNSDAGYTGPCWCRWLVLDIDRADDLRAALTATRQLVSFIGDRYGTDPVTYFSGGKGFHVLIELTHNPAPCVGFSDIAKRYALTLAGRAGVTVDQSIYNVLRPIRLPNTRHPKTGRYKRRIDPDDLFSWDIDAILRHASSPAGDGLPSSGVVSPSLVADWLGAAAESETAAVDRVDGHALLSTRIPAFLREFLRHPEECTNRAVTLFRAAAWLTEQGSPPSLSSAILSDFGAIAGLPPKEIEKQIRDGIAYARRKPIVSVPVTTDDDREREAIAAEGDPLPPGALDFGFGANREPESSCPEWPVWGVIRDIERGEEEDNE
ncbi:hypothetical protein [Mycobacterium sp.]|uniref:hypothetical protein n=1 Tax=Mycobacterium sp. TaxID=1785 RepID=UPI003A8C16D2